MSFVSIEPAWFTIAAGVLCLALSIAYVATSRSVTRDFKLVLSDHRRVLAMALVNQGLALCFIGILVIFAALLGKRGMMVNVVEWASAGMLFVLAFVTAATGGRGEYVMFRFGQLGLLVAALLIAAGKIPR
ncbi:MAG TPA: hypothetical protein VKF42_11115 [Chitinivibrionales bacterium]|jgi:hypothetical protein|nr:hypothetical protein [Chitinivibrionales bacterium]